MDLIIIAKAICISGVAFAIGRYALFEWKHRSDWPEMYKLATARFDPESEKEE